MGPGGIAPNSGVTVAFSGGGVAGRRCGGAAAAGVAELRVGTVAARGPERWRSKPRGSAIVVEASG